MPTVCIIGAGSSGIAGAKVLQERGVPFDCYEKSDRVGGNWVFGNRNGMSSSYSTLHINTSRERMEYSDYPMPKSFPDFPHHTHIAKYFNDYVDHFGFRDKIRFRTGVEHARRREDGVWDVELEGGAAARSHGRGRRRAVVYGPEPARAAGSVMPRQARPGRRRTRRTR